MEISITVSQPPLNQLLKLIFCVLTHQNPQTNIMHFATLALLVLAVVAAVSAGVYGPAVGLGYGAVVPGYGVGAPLGRTFHGSPLINGYAGYGYGVGLVG